MHVAFNACMNPVKYVHVCHLMLFVVVVVVVVVVVFACISSLHLPVTQEQLMPGIGPNASCI